MNAGDFIRGAVWTPRIPSERLPATVRALDREGGFLEIEWPDGDRAWVSGLWLFGGYVPPSERQELTELASC